METDREQLRRLERAEAAPYVDYPPTPAWYYPAAGLWFAAITAVQGLTDDHLPVAIALLGVLLALLGAFSAWYARYRGAMPSLFRRAPRELRGAVLGYLAGAGAVLAAVWWTLAEVGWLPASALMFVLATAGLVLHERSYAAAAARVRDRLS